MKFNKKIAETKKINCYICGLKVTKALSLIALCLCVFATLSLFY